MKPMDDDDDADDEEEEVICANGSLDASTDTDACVEWTVK